MIEPDEVTKRLFIWGVAAVAVFPRLPSDPTYCTIGGNLTHTFRKLLLVLVGTNFVRLFCSKKINAAIALSDALGVVEVVGLTFLCFLTPYLLQRWLSERINIGGRPGENLITPLLVVGFMSAVGMILSHTVHPNLWFLKKAANGLASIPVLRTLRQYNSVTTVGLRINGRGNILSQSLMMVEYWHLIVQLLGAVGYACNTGRPEDEHTAWDVILCSFRNIGFVADWTRVLSHAIFMNVLDEIYSLPPPADQSDPRPSTVPLVSTGMVTAM